MCILCAQPRFSGASYLVVNQYVPLGLALLAPIIANIVTYHLTMQRSGAQLAILATILGLSGMEVSRLLAPLATRNAVLTSD